MAAEALLQLFPHLKADSLDFSNDNISSHLHQIIASAKDHWNISGLSFESAEKLAKLTKVPEDWFDFEQLSIYCCTEIELYILKNIIQVRILKVDYNPFQRWKKGSSNLKDVRVSGEYVDDHDRTSTVFGDKEWMIIHVGFLMIWVASYSVQYVLFFS